jgi:hypothetical protein
MENKTIDIEPRAAVEMQTWENIYDRVPSQYKQYVSYPTTTMQECPSKAEINDKLTHACTTDSDVWTKSYSDTTPIDVITQTNLEFRIIYSEGSPGNNNSQWIFPDEHLNAQAGNYLLTVSQTYKLYLVSVFYIIQ